MNVIWEHGKIKTLLAVLAVLVAVIVAYYPGLNGPFVFDDEIHILFDPTIRITSLSVQSLTNILLTEDGSLSYRPLAKASLAINYYLSGGTSSTYGYKLTNLVIHLVDTWLVYWFTLLLIRRRAWRPSDAKHITPESIAIMVAALWALHPLHLTTVLYVVQRMTSLAMLFVLGGLIVYIHGRERVHEQRDYGYVLMILGAIGGSVLGFICKENAVVLLPLMVVIEFVFFGTASEIPSDRSRLRWFYGLVVFMPATLLGLWLIINPNFILDPYLSRDFTPVQRLLTESRVLWYYLSLLFIPDVRKLSLYHDDIPISIGLFDPWTTSITFLSIIAVVIIAFIARRKYPFISFAILWFLIGHSIESGIIGLEIAHEHRNYLPDIGILLAVGHGLSTAAQKFQKPIRIALLLAPLVTLGFVTNTLAHTWASDKGIIESLVRHHPESARGQYMLAELYAERKHDLTHALAHYRKATELAPHETGYLVKSVLTTAIIESGLGENIGNPPNNSNGKDMNVTTPTKSDDNSKTTAQINITGPADNATINEIALRLKEQPITPTTLHILDQLAPCTDQASRVCKAMYPYIKSWYVATAQNPHISSRDRGNFIIYLFNIGTARPDLDLSIQAIDLGKKFEPTNPVYKIMEANVQVLRGELVAADGTLHSVLEDPTVKLNDDLREDINALFAQIELRKAKVRATQNHYK